MSVNSPQCVLSMRRPDAHHRDVFEESSFSQMEQTRSGRRVANIGFHFAYQFDRVKRGTVS